MKIRFRSIEADERFVHEGKQLSVGDIIDISKERAESLIARGKAEVVKESQKIKKVKSVE